MAYKPKVMLVKWLDSRKGEMVKRVGGLKQIKPCPVWSAGFAEEGEDGTIIVAQDFFPLEPTDSEGDEEFRQWIAIPRSCIMEVVDLTPKDGDA